MQHKKFALLGALGLGATLVAGGTAFAGSAHTPDTVTVPPGYVAVMVPEGAAMPLPADPLALQLDALLSAPMAMPFPLAMPGVPMPMLVEWTTNQAATALHKLPPVRGPVAAEVISSVSEGPEHCTQRVIYPTMNGSKQPEVTDFGNACHALAASFHRADTVDHAAAAPSPVRSSSGTAI